MDGKAMHLLKGLRINSVGRSEEEGKTGLGVAFTTTKQLYSTIGCNPTGMEGGKASHTGPLLILLWQLLVHPTGIHMDSCHKC